jgi:ABC-2 type transport system ATP-binding protein
MFSGPPEDAAMVLRTEGLSKVFELGVRRRKVAAVEDLTLSATEGEIFGFVGPNGAGKTTTIKMLMGLIFPTRGRAFIFDAPIPSDTAKKRIGYLPENPAYYEFLSGLEAMRFFAQLAEVPSSEVDRRSKGLLERVGLADAADRQIRKYSKGMLQRLGIAQALVADPAFVILDEPMSGLDPLGRKEVRDLILELKQQGKTVFFSTHILTDVETLCDRMAVIMHGRLRDVGKLGDLISAKVRSTEVTADLDGGDASALSGGRLLARDGTRVTVVFDDENEADAAVRVVVTSGARLIALTRHRETLEDFFLRRLGEGPAASGAPSRFAG